MEPLFNTNNFNSDGSYKGAKTVKNVELSSSTNMCAKITYNDSTEETIDLNRIEDNDSYIKIYFKNTFYTIKGSALTNRILMKYSGSVVKTNFQINLVNRYIISTTVVVCRMAVGIKLPA